MCLCDNVVMVLQRYKIELLLTE